MKILIFTCLALSVSPLVLAQSSPSETTKKFALKNPNLKIEPFIQLQAWGVRSLERQAELDGDTAKLDSADQRTNFYLRRGRFGFRGKPYENLNFTLSLYYDNTGHDSLGATRGGTNPGASGPVTVGVWDSYLTWKISDSDLFHVSAGYFTPQISRDSITSPFRISSFEQGPSQSYVRRSVIGRSYGRSTGLNVGGLKHQDDFGFNYNIGVFNKNTTGGNKTETQGDENSLVYVGRVAATFGDAEMKKYGFGYQTNYFGRRNGLTLALNGSTQERTQVYKANRVIGADMLFNYKNLNIDSEFFYIFKKGLGEDSYARARTGHFRMGYNFFLDNGTVLEPAFMISSYFGEKGSDFTGRDTVYDVGLNWYLDENNYKLYVHYVNQDGEGSNNVHKDGTTSGYHYGDYVGVGLTLQF